MNAQQEFQNISSPELIEQAYTEQDQEKYWQIIGILHKRGAVNEFRLAEDLCRNQDPVRREIGADVLGQLGWQNRSCHTESVAILMRLLTDSEANVVASAAFSLGHRQDAVAIPELIKLIQHSNQRVRLGITFGLCGHEDQRAIEALITLSGDNDEEVRNWATFGLGTQIDTKSEAINAALLARLTETNQEIRGEALVGLARRSHPITTKELINELNSEEINMLILEAAELCADSRLYPILLEWKNTMEKDTAYFEKQLNRALEACNPDK